MGNLETTEALDTLSGTHAEFVKNGIIEQSNVQPMSRARAKIVFSLLFLFREENNTIEDAVPFLPPYRIFLIYI